MTTHLCKLISDNLKLNPYDFSSNTMRIIIEDKLNEAKSNVLGHIGTKEVQSDITITKEENNKLFQLQNLHNLFMEEMSIELTETLK